jgi:RNA recognition motif-containing protein
MSVRLFVGGLAFTTSTDGLRDAFARFGPVQSAAVMTDRETGRSRGFGFVEMASEQEAERAISALNGSSLDGRMIRVDKATPRGAGGPPRPRPAGGFAPRSDRPAGGGFAPRPSGGGFGGPRPSGGGGPRVGAGGWTPPMPEGRSGNRRGDRRAGPPGPGGDQGRPKKPGGRKNVTPQDRRGGRGRLGSDGDYRWGR